MQPIRIIDSSFDLLAEIDNYESLVWTRRWHKPGEFELHINANKQSTEYLQNGRLVLAGSKAGIILHRELVQGPKGKGEEQVVAKGMSLAAIVGRRITLPPAGYAYDRVNAAAETIMKGYVTRNCIAPTDSKRVIPSLVVATDQGRGEKIVFQTRLKQLDEELGKLSLVSGLGWDVLLDWKNKQWVFDVLEGRDLTAGQSTNPPVIFSADFDAVKAQTFVESDIGHRNQAYVGGQGEGVERDIVEVGSGLSGLERLETFVDARDLEQTADLPERGLQKLAEVAPVLTFDTEILTEGPYKYGTDWDLGDVVTVQNRKWNVTLDSRITEVTEIYEPAGFQLRATFGSSIPTLPDRIKQELDAPLVEKGLLEKGDPGEPGTDGVGLNFLWDGTRLGVKREDEALYTYVDLEGPQGIQGPPGEKGDPGAKGDKGDPGPKGDKGDTGPKGDTGERGPKGDKGDMPDHEWSGAQLRFERPDGSWGDYVNLQGPKGDKGDKGDTGPKGDTGERGPKGDKGEPGQPGQPGTDGVGLEFSWDGTRLGVRREGDAAYQYVDLKGEKGDVGLQGKSLEFSWNGTQLGIRAEGDSVYQYVDLEGPQGPEGPPGSDATVTQTNIEGALGYTPVSPTQLATKASAAETNAKAYTDTRLADKASNIHTHSIDDITSLDIEIGGRNLFIDNLMLNVQNYEYISPYYYYEITGLIPDQVYTISVRDDFDFSGVPKPTAGNRAIRINNIKQNSTNNVINVTSTGVTTATIQISSNDEGMLYIVVYQPVILEHFPQAIKLEKGNVATDWTPAPEDINAVVQTIFKNKVDKVAGKQLSSEDYTTTEKTKLAGIEAEANKYIHPASHPASMITESTSQRFVSDTEKAAWNAKAEGAHSHAKADITDMPTKLSEFENDIGAGAGLNIVVSPTEPAGLSTGDWWYKEV